MFVRTQLLTYIAIASLGMSGLHAQEQTKQISPTAIATLQNQRDLLQKVQQNPSLWLRLQRWSAIMNAFVLKFYKEKKDPITTAQQIYKKSHFEQLPDDPKMVFFEYYLKGAKTVNDVNDYVAAFSLISPDVDLFIQEKLAQKIIKMRKKQIRLKEEKPDLQEVQKKLDNENIPVNVIRYGIDAYDPENGQTALHYAIEKNNPELVKELMKYDADIMAKDAEGKTPINKILKLGRSEMLKTVFKNTGLEEGLKLYVRPKPKLTKPKKFKQDMNFTKTKGQ